MARTLAETGTVDNPLNELTLLKLGSVAVCYVLYHAVAYPAVHMMMWQGERKNIIRTGCLLFASGVCLGTAMMDLLRVADVIFLGIGIRFPLAFLLSCTGYAVAMVADCLLAHLVWSLGREDREINLQDKILLWFISKVHPVKYCDTTSPVLILKLETKDCDSIGAQTRDLIFHRLTVLGDGIFIAATFGLLFIQCGNNIWSANTTTMLATAFVGAVVKHIVYAATLFFTLLRNCQPRVYIQGSLFILGLSGTYFSFIRDFFFSSGNKGLVGVRGANEGAWYVGIFSGFFSGSLVYIAVHHLLAGRYRLENGSMLSGFGMVGVLSMLSGIGMVGVMKFLAN